MFSTKSQTQQCIKITARGNVVIIQTSTEIKFVNVLHNNLYHMFFVYYRVNFVRTVEAPMTNAITSVNDVTLIAEPA